LWLFGGVVSNGVTGIMTGAGAAASGWEVVGVSVLLPPAAEELAVAAAADETLWSAGKVGPALTAEPAKAKAEEEEEEAEEAELWLLLREWEAVELELGEAALRGLGWWLGGSTEPTNSG
jgi:hypothetical protein